MNASPSERFRRVDTVFDAVLDLPADEQSAGIDRACGDDTGLRDELHELLRAYRDSERFLEMPALQVAAPFFDAGATARGPVPDRIGPFRIVREIGRGGMGTVFLAERADGQFEQRVALKLIQNAAPGIVRRFMDERRILALLEHPCIARLIDGGIAPGGLPYFAMEFVDGERIDSYCARRGLTLENRLDLFTSVCDAVSYAHQHLVIHRDLKPSNILVTATGQVKLLDFGIAKLLLDPPPGHDVTRTAFLAMTPEFAAPEQVRGAPVSTATDVYSLGVLLYMLLTGERPYDVRGRMPSEIERIVCTEDPPNPSSRAPAAQQRRLRGDLDRIVMTALNKEASRRYASVQELSDDILRHLSGHPIRARRPTARYRTLRFVKRHALAMSALGIIAVLLVAYAISMTVQRTRVERALAEARVGALKAEQVTDFMLGLFQASERGQAFADTLTARELLNRGIARAREMSGQAQVKAQLLDAVGRIHMQLGEFDAARDVFEEALAARRTVLDDDHADIATSLANVADAARNVGDYDTAVALSAQALAIRRRVLGRLNPLTLETIYWYGHALHESGDPDAAQPFFDEWIAGVAALPIEVTPGRATLFVNLSQLLTYGGDHDLAERLLRQAIVIRREIFGERHVSVANALSELANVHLSAGRLQDAEDVERQAVALLRSLYPDGHPDLASAIRGLAVILHRRQHWQEAEALYVERLAMVRRFYGDEHTFHGRAHDDLGLLFHSQRLYDRAEPHIREAVRIHRAGAGAHSLFTKHAEVLLGNVLRVKGQYAEAEPLLLDGYAALSQRRVPGFEYGTRVALEALVELYETQGRTDEAAKYRALIPPVRPLTRE